MGFTNILFLIQLVYSYSQYKKRKCPKGHFLVALFTLITQQRNHKANSMKYIPPQTKGDYKWELKVKTTKWLYLHVKNAKKETIQQQKTKKQTKKEWSLKNIAQDAISTLFIKKQNNDVPAGALGLLMKRRQKHCGNA